jgi:thiol-disulfide isomerase/thioredoxin
MYKFIFTFIILGFITNQNLLAQNTLPKAMVNDVNGNAIDISKYVVTGKPKIISLWATWCGPCRMELNALQKVYPKWKQNYGVEIIAVTVDVGPQLARAKSMFEKNEWTYTFLHDNNQELMGQLGVRGIPYSILLDGKGKIVSVQTGYYPGYEKELETKIKNL